METPLVSISTRNWDELEAFSPFDVIICDPPWDYYGSKDKMGAAGKHYNLMKDEELSRLAVKNIMAKPSVLFMWTTSSALQRSINLMNDWGLFYRGIAFVWVKTSKSGCPIGAQGVRPSITKPLTELVIVGSTVEKGRPLPLADEGVQQTVFAPRGRHSEKPEIVQDRITSLYPTARKAELFARRPRNGWVCWGNEA